MRLLIIGALEGQLSEATKLEWVDGGIVREQVALEVEIDNRIAAFLAARRGNPETGAF